VDDGAGVAVLGLLTAATSVFAVAAVRVTVSRLGQGLLLLVLAFAGGAWAQVSDPWQGQRIEAVRIALSEPIDDEARRSTLHDKLRRTLNVFPGVALRPLQLDWGLARLRGLPEVSAADAQLQPGPTGGVIITVSVRLAGTGAAPGEAAAAVPAWPVLWRSEDALLKFKLTAASLGYANRNAWYGQPGDFVGANPLATQPSGAGWAPWVEGAFEIGLQGIAPIAPSVYVYGSLSGMVSGSAGTELFTDEPRSYSGVEDAYLGVLTGKTLDDGSRLVANLSVGRQPFQIADGMLIRITAGNGFDRAALQLNPRWAADNLWLAEARYNDHSIEVFRLDPDELPAIDSRTIVYGLNFETGIGSDQPFGASLLYVPQSSYGYYTPTAVGTRAGLVVLDARAYWLPQALGLAGPFVKAEAALQRNDRNTFPMRAWGGYVEGGWLFADRRWRPSFSYRLSAFSGDNPSTSTYERWDPLLSGGTPEEWVQGINHYKLFQDSNVVAHRLQSRLQTSAQSELVSQLWLFRAQQTNNLGGALSTLAGRSLGWEVNLTGKYYPSRNLYLQAGMAATFPLSGVQDAVGNKLSPWISAVLLARLSY
jgi:hypothetical protein